jgi:hypothetical protein
MNIRFLDYNGEVITVLHGIPVPRIGDVVKLKHPKYGDSTFMVRSVTHDYRQPLHEKRVIDVQL